MQMQGSTHQENGREPAHFAPLSGSARTTRISSSVVAAVPRSLAPQVVVDACNAGKDILSCEKPMSHNVADGSGWGARRRKIMRIMQIGSQRVSLCYAPRRANFIRTERSATSRWWNSRWDETIPPARGNFTTAVPARKPQTGRRGSTTHQRFRSTSCTSRAGAAGEPMAQEWRAI